MKKIAFSLVACLTLTVVVKAQFTDWESKPNIHTLKFVNENESAVVIDDSRIVEFMQEEKRGSVMLVTNKKIFKVNDDNGVEMYNKIYLPIYYGAEILQVKARTILPDGKVINLPASKILDVEEEGRKYKKFAMEGVEKGSEIEYFYQYKKEASFFGLEVFQANSGPFENASFTLITPDYLSFSIKGYNGFTVGADSVIGKKRIVKAVCKDIIPVDEEKYGNREAFSKNVQYKLSYNLSKAKNVKIFTWNELAKNVYNNYTTYTDKEVKAVDGFLKNIDIKSTASEEEKIVAVEDYIKININSDKDGIGEDADIIEKIVKTKVSSNKGLYKLFVISMDRLKINWQIVFPSKRDELPLDEELENYKLIDEMLFYFPSTGRFLEPANPSFRYPYITPYWAATKGLFLQGTTIGNFKTALASFSDIYMQPMDESAHNMEVTLRFNSKMDSLLVHSKQILKGYGATVYRPAYTFTPKDKIDELSKEIIKSVANSDVVKNIKVQNTALTDGFLNKSLIIEGDIVTTEMIEVAGKKILLKIGSAIGPQVEMYQEKARQLPISIQYPHVLDREIKLIIPEGYTIKNLSDIELNITDKNSGKETMGFVSTYKLNGNELNISVHEFYEVTDYPVTAFDAFTKVINASADFNKVVLILEKK